jgi:selenocysteine-specific elongation factor
VHVVATAGHVDHGKSSLVLALTGTDPDRFAEEKARGLTIDLGFAWTTLPSGQELAFVDVPGHVRFLRNMLAGVGAVEACLFVVAATEGWKPQSEEHLRILDVLGMEHGVVALTKVGVVDAGRRAAARAEVLDRVAGTFLEKAPLVEVDAVDGTGLHRLRTALDDLVANAPGAVDRGRPRLWVDRSFAARGAGTIVTGTLAGGALAVGDELLLLPDGTPVRVRGLQTHKTTVERVEPGRRVAVNLAGISHDRVARGHALVRPGQWAPTRTVDCSLTVLASLDHDASRRGAYAAYIGSGEHPVSMRVLGADRIPPGGRGFVRLHLPEPVPLLPGDRYVLRESGRSETVGGGEVLDVAPVLPAARAAPTRSVDRVIAERGWVDTDELERLTGERREPTVGAWVVAPDAHADAVTRVRDAVAAAGPAGLDVAMLDDRDRAVLAAVDDITVEAGRARSATAGPTPPHPYLDALTTSPFTPPAPDGVDRAALRDLVRRGLAVERDGVWFAASAVEAATRVVARLLAESPEGITASAVREALGTSRKYVLPLLGHLDATGMTRRRGDLRIAGPRLPVAAREPTRQSDPPGT